MTTKQEEMVYNTMLINEFRWIFKNWKDSDSDLRKCLAAARKIKRLRNTRPSYTRPIS